MILVEGAEIFRHSEGIVQIRFRPQVGIELNHAEEIIQAVLEVAGGKRHGNLVDATRLMFMSTEARQRFGRQSPHTLTGTAIVVRSTLQRTLGNLYLTVSRPANPTKLFATLSDGVSWLHTRNAETDGRAKLPSSLPPGEMNRTKNNAPR